MKKEGSQLSLLLHGLPAEESIRIPLDDVKIPAYCRAQPMQRARRVIVECSFSGLHSMRVIEVRDGRDGNRIVFEVKSEERTAPPGTFTVFHDPILLPTCPLPSFTFHAFTWRDPKWARLGSQCNARCYDKQDACREPCLSQHTDEKGELTEEGTKCDAACSDAFNQCATKCVP